MVCGQSATHLAEQHSEGEKKRQAEPHRPQSANAEEARVPPSAAPVPFVEPSAAPPPRVPAPAPPVTAPLREARRPCLGRGEEVAEPGLWSKGGGLARGKARGTGLIGSLPRASPPFQSATTVVLGTTGSCVPVRPLVPAEVCPAVLHAAVSKMMAALAHREHAAAVTSRPRGEMPRGSHPQRSSPSSTTSNSSRVVMAMGSSTAMLSTTLWIGAEALLFIAGFQLSDFQNGSIQNEAELWIEHTQSDSGGAMVAVRSSRQTSSQEESDAP